MPRPIELYLRDILDAIIKVESYALGLSQEQLENDTAKQDAILFNLIVIGEAAKQVPDDRRVELADIEWRKIAGFRDIVVHQYFRVNLIIVWDIIQNHLPPLKRTIEDFLQNNTDSESDNPHE